MAQVTLDELNRMDQRTFVAALGDIFEHAPWVAEAAHRARPFPSLNALYEAMTAAVRGAGDAPPDGAHQRPSGSCGQSRPRGNDDGRLQA